MGIEEIFDTYYNRVYRFTLFRVQNAHDAEDITSEVFLKAAKNLWRYNAKKAAMSTWLFSITLNEIKMFYRKRRDTLLLEYAKNIPERENIEDTVLVNERAKLLYAAIALLDERQRNIVLLRYYGEMSNKEIARLLNLTETNVGTILSRTIKILRKYLETCDEPAAIAYKLTEGREQEAGNVR